MSLQQIITPEWLQSVYLFGVDLTDDNNDPYPDEMWLHAIDSAIATAEAQFDVVMRANRRAKHVERHDSIDFLQESWHLMMLQQRPIQRINSLSIRFGDREPTALPSSWVHVTGTGKAGQIQIIPGQDAFGGYGFNFNGMGFNLLHHRYLPGWFEVDYEAGFEFRLKGTATVSASQKSVTLAAGVDDDGAATVPDAATELKAGMHVVFDDLADNVYRVRSVLSDTSFTVDKSLPVTVTASNVTVLDYDPMIIDFVGLVASMLPLDTAGDLIIGAGISSQSLSMDGLSQSISTTSGVENSGYGARMISYRKRLEGVAKQLTRHYRPINMFVV